MLGISGVNTPLKRLLLHMYAVAHAHKKTLPGAAVVRSEYPKLNIGVSAVQGLGP